MNEAFTLAVAQFNPAIADLQRNRDRILAFADDARAEGAKMLITGELALSGYMLRDAVYDVALRDDDPFLDPFRSLSREMTVIVGMAEASRDHLYYNSALVFEDGEVIHRHRKVYLPTYGMFEEKRFFAEGDRIRAFDSRLGRFGLLVCNDMWHPMTAQLLGWDSASMILAPTASPTRGVGSDEVSDNTRVWRTFNRATAKAISAYVVQANIVGFQDSVHFWGGSEVVTPGGIHTQQAPLNEEALLLAEVDPEELRRERVYSPVLRDERLSLEHRELSRILQQGRRT